MKQDQQTQIYKMMRKLNLKWKYIKGRDQDPWYT